MPWKGDGTFERTDGTRTGSTVWAQAKAAIRNILSVDHDVHDQDLADGIAACLTQNGETVPSANLPMNSMRHTGVADAEDDDDYAAWGQVKTLVAPAVKELNSSASVEWNAGSDPMAKITLSRNVNLSITGGVEGRVSMLWLQQDATGGRTLMLPTSSVLDLGALDGTIDLTANEISLLTFIYMFGKFRLTAQRQDFSG